MKSLISTVIVVVCVCLFTVNGSGFGRCPNYPSMGKFNISGVTNLNEIVVKLVFDREILFAQFLGQWYEVERSFYLPEIALGCTKIIFESNSDNERSQNFEITLKSLNQW